MRITPRSLPFSFTKRAQPIIIFVVVLVLVLLLVRIPAFSRIRTSLQFASTKVGTSFGNVWTRVFQTGDSIHADRDHYRDLAATLATETATLEEAQTRIRELETLLGYQESTTLSTTVARIIARAPEGDLSLLLDKGSREGIFVGMPVTAEGSHLVAVISQVRDHTSVARLLNDPLSAIPASILGDDRTLGLVEGKEGFLLHMQYIPQDKSIEKNDVVVTSGLGSLTPKDLVIGVVSDVVKVESAPFQGATIEPLVDLRTVSYLTIITGHQPL